MAICLLRVEALTGELFFSPRPMIMLQFLMDLLMAAAYRHIPVSPITALLRLEPLLILLLLVSPWPGINTIGGRWPSRG